MPSVVKHARIDSIPVLPLIPSDVKKLGDQVGGPAETRVALAEEDKPCLLHSSPMHTNPSLKEGIPTQGLLGRKRREKGRKRRVLWRNHRRWTRMAQFPPKKRRTDVVRERGKWKTAPTKHEAWQQKPPRPAPPEAADKPTHGPESLPRHTADSEHDPDGPARA